MAMGFKKNKEKKAFAKDKKQAVLAVLIFIVFLATSANAVIKVHQAQQPDTATGATSPSVNPGEQPASIAPDGATGEQSLTQDAKDIYSKTALLVGVDPQNTSVDQKTPPATIGEDVDIMTKKKARGKMVTIDVSESGRSNPFLPAAENIPKSALPFLTPPPETLSSHSDASKIITTVISGIMYDKYSPSAIINIEGTDYLVKKGDVVNHYKILSITKTQVLVQLGRNIYRAGVGELLSQTDLNCNAIANLDKKFGGNTIPIKVKRKGY